MDLMEKRLVKQAREGSREAFSELVHLYKDKIYHLGYRMLGQAQEAEDVAQETFIRVFSHLHKYDEKRKFSTWIYRIATNLCIDRIRKRKPDFSLDAEVKGTDDLNYYATLSSKEQTPEEQTMIGEVQQSVQEAISSLRPTYRSIMILRYIEDLSLKEISEVLELPVSTVKTRIHRGREALRKKLGSI